jgi:hypothetical protein
MSGRVLRAGAAGIALMAALSTLASCSGDADPGSVDRAVPPGSYRLVAFDSCAEALTALRGAYSASAANPNFYEGRGGGVGVAEDATGAAPTVAGAEKSAVVPGPAQPQYSGTNTHEAGVDEPDIVKTDGKRIVTVMGGTLRIIDAASRRYTASLTLPLEADQGYGASNLLLAGDHALVMVNSYGRLAAYKGAAVDNVAPGVGVPEAAPDQGSQGIMGPRLILVDLSVPRVLSSVSVDGNLLDARQVGATARVVVASSPRITFPYLQGASPARQAQSNRDIIAQAGIDAWTPRIEVTTDGKTTRSDVPCGSIARPATYSGASLLTVLTFDISSRTLDGGRPVTLVADGSTVYSNGPSLYIASDQRWRAVPAAGSDKSTPAQPETEIYRFDTSGNGRPHYVGGGTVPGYLINQYAMSEWNGNLRIATTTDSWVGTNGAQRTTSESGVHVLTTQGGRLTEVGTLTGLGKGERIYAVRFVGPVGYVVTFKQTDPLYTVDLSDPKSPTLRGALKIPGFSAYLHPIEAQRMLGIGQGATQSGRITGTQVSLFDVGNLDDPARLATYTLADSNSQAEYDPHAFLYWPAEKLLVVPLQAWNVAVREDAGPSGAGTTGVASAPSKQVTVGALVLRVSDSSISKVGFVSLPAADQFGGYNPPIERSLVIDRTLWTVGQTGVQANDLGSLARQAWLPFS